MCLLSFKKISSKQNPLFDEFFVEFNTIKILSFNYNAQGAALCLCDDVLMAIDAHRLDKILFGVHSWSLENYLKSIFDPDSHSDEIHRTGGELIFKSQELTKLKKYDLYNLAKKTLKEFTDLGCKNFLYFEEVQETSDQCDTTCASTQENLYFGNVNSQVLHKKSCNSFNPETCTVSFSSTKEAEEAGYKLCGQCKP